MTRISVANVHDNRANKFWLYELFYSTEEHVVNMDVSRRLYICGRFAMHNTKE
jgi:hypothetical protein